MDTSGSAHDSRRGSTRIKRRRPIMSALTGVFRPSMVNRSTDGENTGGSARFHKEEYGVTDYRLIPSWCFPSQPLLEPEDRERMSIGTLYVRVVEARGLLSADISGRSDPYVKLCLTGRYLSHGQEWSERLRLREQTHIVKYNLDPVWDEEFSFPIRRAGAILKVEVWDWDRSSADDPLGHFEVTVGEELLSQEPIDMWYVLQTPEGLEGRASMAAAAAAAALAKRRGGGSKEEDDDELDGNSGHLGRAMQGLEDMSVQALDDDSASQPASPGSIAGADTGSVAGNGGSDGGSRKTTSGYWQGLFRRKGTSAPDHPGLHHVHNTEAEGLACPVCIDLRRMLFGEVRLELWFQFDPFAEMCSHVWPEEPLQPATTHFSPNQLYRKGMLLFEMAVPYRDAALAANEIMDWVHPWRSLLWMVVLVIMLAVPHLLIIGFHVWLIRMVLSAYWRHRIAQSEASLDSGGDADGPDASLSASGKGDSGKGRGSGSGRISSVRGVLNAATALKKGTQSSSSSAAQGASTALSTSSPGDGSQMDEAGPDHSSTASRSSSSWRLPSLGASRPRGRRHSGEPIPASEGGASMHKMSTAPSRLLTVPETSAASGGEGNASRVSTAPGGTPVRSSSSPLVGGMPSDPASSENSKRTTTVARPSSSSSSSSSSSPSSSSSSSSSPSSSPSSPPPALRPAGGRSMLSFSGAASAAMAASSLGVARTTNTTSATSAGGDQGGSGLASGSAFTSAGSAGEVSGWVATKGKKLMREFLPSFVREDPEMNELSNRLENTKRLPAILNELGKRLLGKNGPVLQRQLDRAVLMLVEMRHRFHPLTFNNAFKMTTALSSNMLLQLWLYDTGRFNVYLVLVCLGQFFFRYYKRWGKAFVLGAKEAIRSRKFRLSLAKSKATGGSGASNTSNPGSNHTSSCLRLGPNPRFAPPGSTLHVPDPGHMPWVPNVHASAMPSTSPYGLPSPVRHRRRGSSHRTGVGVMPPSSPPRIRRLFDREGTGELSSEVHPPVNGDRSARGPKGVSLVAVRADSDSGDEDFGSGTKSLVGRTSALFSGRKRSLARKVGNKTHTSASSGVSSSSGHGRSNSHDEGSVSGGGSRARVRAGSETSLETSALALSTARVMDDPAMHTDTETVAGTSGLRYRGSPARAKTAAAKRCSSDNKEHGRDADGEPRGRPSAERPPGLHRMHSGRIPARSRLRVRWGRVYAALALAISLTSATLTWMLGYRFVPCHLEGVGWAETVPGRMARAVMGWRPFGGR